jgi:outer membrane autotransporter protein
VFGADAEISSEWRLGGILGYSHLTMQPQATVDSYHAGLYITGEAGPLDLTGGAIYSRNEVATRRDIAFGQFSDRLRADYESDTAQVFADLSWTLEADPLKLQPFANVAYVHLDTDAFRESGGAAKLSSSDASDELTLSTIGIRWWADLPAAEMPVELSGMLGWRHAIGDLSPSARLAFADPGFFTIAGVPLPRDALVVEAGLSAGISETAWLALTYVGEFADGVQSSAGRASLRVNF